MAHALKLSKLIIDYGYSKANDTYWNSRSKVRQQILIDLLQLCVDYLGRDYTVKKTDVENENIDDFLIINIFNSDPVNTQLSFNVCFADFIKSFLDNVYIYSDFDSILLKSTEFLKKIAQNTLIPENDKFKATACFLLISQINALCYYTDGQFNEGSYLEDSSDENQMIATECLDDILEVNGYSCKKIGEVNVKMFCLAVENNAMYLIDKKAVLNTYGLMLDIDNNAILITVFKSLNNLCTVKEIRYHLLNFFYEAKLKILCKNENNKNSEMLISVMDVLFQLALTSKTMTFQAEALNLFKSIKNLDINRELFIRNQRYKIYLMNFLGDHQTIFPLVLELINLLEKNPMDTLVEMFYQRDATNAFMKRVLLMFPIEKFCIMDLVEIILEYRKKDSAYTSYACRTFSLVTKYFSITDEKTFTREVNVILSMSAKNEKIFGTFLELLLKLFKTKTERVCEFLTMAENHELCKQLIKIIFNAIKKYNGSITVYRATAVLKFFEKNSIHNTKTELEKVLDSLYNEFIAMEVKHILEINGMTKPIQNRLLMKMSFIYELELKAFNDFFVYHALITACESHLQHDSDPSFTHFARFYTTILKFIFLISVKQKVENDQTRIFPIDLYQIMDNVNVLRQKLFRKLGDRSFNLFEARNILTSLLELLWIFHVRPTIFGNDRLIFIKRYRISSRDFTDIVNFIEHYVFKVDSIAWQNTFEEDDYHSFHQETIIKSFVDFSKNYSFPNNCTSLYKLLYYYDNENYFKDFETIMKFLKIKYCFADIIGEVILKFAKEEQCWNIGYYNFVERISKFLDAEGINIKFKVGKYIVDNVNAFATKNNLLNTETVFFALDFMRVFMSGGITVKEKSKIKELVFLCISFMELDGDRNALEEKIFSNLEQIVTKNNVITDLKIF